MGFPQEELLEFEVLHEGTKKRKTAQLIIIRHKTKGVRYKLNIDEYLIEKDGTEKHEHHIPLSEEATEKLLSYLLTREEYAKLADTTFYTILKGSAPLDQPTLTRVVETLRTALGSQQIDRILDEALRDNFSAVIQQIRYKKAVTELEDKLKQNLLEDEYRKWFLEHPWVFGTEYERPETKTRKVGWNSRGDIILTSVDGYQDLIELKRPDSEVFRYDESHDNYYPSQELSKALSQVIKYLQSSEDVRLQIKEFDNLPFLKPRGRIVIGRTTQWVKEKHETLRKLNCTLQNIQIMTYDHLINQAKRMIKYYEEQQQA